MVHKRAPQALINAALTMCPELMELPGPIIAGGFIRAYYAGEKYRDMDLYFRNESDFDMSVVTLKDKGWESIFETDRAVTLKKGSSIIQPIRFIFGSPEDLIHAFDFTICCAAMALSMQYVVDEGENLVPFGDLYLHDDFFEHLAGRLLVFQGSDMPLSSLKRVIKYVRRGYNICDENLILVAETLYRTVNFTDRTSVEDHIAGMDPDGGRRIRVVD